MSCKIRCDGKFLKFLRTKQGVDLEFERPPYSLIVNGRKPSKNTRFSSNSAAIDGPVGLNLD
jgi:hypothetical protein